MADSSLVVAVELEDPLNGVVAGAKHPSLAALANLFQGLTSGAKRARIVDIWQGGADVKSAYGTGIAAAVQAADTISLNGKALTATQHHSSGTITCSGADNADTVTINGVVFTGAAAEDIAAGEFSTGGSDTEDAASLVACINGSVDPLIAGVVTAANSAGVVTVRAVTPGAAMDAITLVSSDGTDLAVSGSGTLEGGAAVGAEEFDYVGTNTQTATAIAQAVNSSTDAALQYLVGASNISGAFALSNSLAGNYAEIAVAGVGHWRFIAGTDWTVSGTDTQDGDSLASAINGTDVLNRHVVAINTTGTVRVYQRSGTTATASLSAFGNPITVTAMAARDRVLFSALQSGIAGNTVTLASSHGSRLAVSAARLANGTGGNVAKISFTL